MDYCANCDKNIDSGKFDLHLGYCRRNFKRCKLCNRAYDINNQEEHNEQFHNLQKCTHCQKEINASQLKGHEKNCQSKPIQCTYCELSVPIGSFESHRAHCESRTSKCESCLQLIINRDMMNHLSRCTGQVIKSVGTKSRKQQQSVKIGGKQYQFYHTFVQQQKRNGFYHLNDFGKQHNLIQGEDPQLQAALLQSSRMYYGNQAKLSNFPWKNK